MVNVRITKYHGRCVRRRRSFVPSKSCTILKPYVIGSKSLQNILSCVPVVILCGRRIHKVLPCKITFSVTCSVHDTFIAHILHCIISQFQSLMVSIVMVQSSTADRGAKSYMTAHLLRRQWPKLNRPWFIASSFYCNFNIIFHCADELCHCGVVILIFISYLLSLKIKVYKCRALKI